MKRYVKSTHDVDEYNITEKAEAALAAIKDLKDAVEADDYFYDLLSIDDIEDLGHAAKACDNILTSAGVLYPKKLGE